MKEVRIYDCHNWLRRKFETGASQRLVYAIATSAPGIMVFDGYGAKKRRKDLYPDYKKHRNVASDEFFKQLEIFEKLCAFIPSPKIRVPGWEADDVIATLIRRSPDDRYFIETTDVDFLQLPNTSIDRIKPAPCPTKWLRLYKTLVGDSSDNVKGLKGFGEKGWAALTDDQRQALQDFITGDISPLTDLPVISEKFNRGFLENIEQLRVYWKIVGLMDVPWDEIIKHTTVGRDDPDGVEAALKSMLQ